MADSPTMYKFLSSGVFLSSPPVLAQCIPEFRFEFGPSPQPGARSWERHDVIKSVNGAGLSYPFHIKVVNESDSERPSNGKTRGHVRVGELHKPLAVWNYSRLNGTMEHELTVHSPDDPYVQGLLAKIGESLTGEIHQKTRGILARLNVDPEYLSAKLKELREGFE